MPEYGKFYNGIGISRKMQNSFDNLENCDVHSDIGSLLCQRVLTKKSGDVVTAGCFRAVAPNGDTYFFSKTDGKIFKRAISDGTYSLVRTGVNGAYKGATYYRNYIYYTMDGFLGRFDFGSTWNDNFNVLTTGVPHPLFQFDLILYIGNGFNVASLDDAGVFSASVLDQNVEDIIYAFTNLGDDLLTLSNPGSYINDSSITRWNTFGDSWSVKDNIKQKGAFAFLDSDNYVHVVCSSGDIYLFNGAQLELFSNIRDAVATTEGHQLTTNFQGKPLIANGGRIYSLHRQNRNLPFALVGEYTCSAGASATIESIVANGSQLLVSWTNNGTAGIDEIDENYFANVRVTTPRFKKANRVKVYYDELNGAEIGIYSRKDSENNWTPHEVIDDSEDERFVRTVDDLNHLSGGQALITITPVGTVSPVIDFISVE